MLLLTMCLLHVLTMLLLHVLPGQRLLLPGHVQRLLPVLPMLPGQRLLLPLLLPMLTMLTMLLLPALPILLHVRRLPFQVNGQHRKATVWPKPPIQGYRFSLVFGEWPS
jgi:hypothetical protein